MRTNEDKWSSLKRNIILWNSSGKINSNLFSAKEIGNKIYCSRKFCSGILAIDKIIKKVKMKINEPIRPKIIFLILKLKAKWIIDKKTIIRKICPEGACFVRKDIPIIIGSNNQ